MASVLSVGTAVVDFVMTVDHLPTEGRKYRASEATIVGGGCAANAAIAIARLGGESLLAGHLGTDAVGDLIIGGLEVAGVDCGLIRRDPDLQSSFSNIMVDGAGERMIVNYRDPRFTDSDADWLAKDMPEVGAVLADTRWPAGAVVAMRAARQLGIPGVVDAEAPLGDGTECLPLASHVAFAADGLRDFAGVDDLDQGLEIASKRLPGFVAVTDGANGVRWRHGGDGGHIPADPVDVVDTLGAGDVWHGAFALALAEGMETGAALRFAGATAAIKCGRPGGSRGSPTRGEVDAFIRGRER